MWPSSSLPPAGKEVFFHELQWTLTQERTHGRATTRDCGHPRVQAHKPRLRDRHAAFPAKPRHGKGIDLRAESMRSSAAIAALLLVVASTASAKGRLDKEPVDYVDPNIGGIGQLLTATSPYVQYPHGMVRLAPITTPGITDRYLADKIYGFPVGQGLIMMPAGTLEPRRAAYASDFDHDL